ncbi:MAG TPA: hypothetical protein DGJ56_09140, partial [Verrucomicrobiales bacterium]|nr:hypothetical protein [Verrucomicrobiales bacterium]
RMIGKTINGHTQCLPCLSPVDSSAAIAFHRRTSMDRKIATFLCLFTLLNSAQAEKAKPTKPNTVDHAGLMQAWDEASLKHGQTIYNNLCVNYHGADGRTPSL